MAKNRTMQAKNAKVRKEDIKRKKERQMINVIDTKFAGKMPEKVLECAGYIPNYKGNENVIGRHGIKIVKEYKSAAKTALMERL